MSAGIVSLFIHVIVEGRMDLGLNVGILVLPFIFIFGLWS